MYAGLDLLLWALLLAGIVLWNLLKAAARRARARAEVPVPEHQPARTAQSGRTRADAQAAPHPLSAGWGRGAGIEPEPALASLKEPDRARHTPFAQGGPPVAERRLRRWRTRGELRRAFSDAVVLGPPRSLEPWGAGEAAAGSGTARPRR